jgi:hypothetical protein
MPIGPKPPRDQFSPDRIRAGIRGRHLNRDVFASPSTVTIGISVSVSWLLAFRGPMTNEVSGGHVTIMPRCYLGELRIVLQRPHGLPASRLI